MVSDDDLKVDQDKLNEIQQKTKHLAFETTMHHEMDHAALPIKSPAHVPAYVALDKKVSYSVFALYLFIYLFDCLFLFGCLLLFFSIIRVLKMYSGSCTSGSFLVFFCDVRFSHSTVILKKLSRNQQMNTFEYAMSRSAHFAFSNF